MNWAAWSRPSFGGLVAVVAALVLGALSGWWSAAHSAPVDRQLLRAEWWALAVSVGINTVVLTALILLPLGLLVTYLLGRRGRRG